MVGKVIGRVVKGNAAPGHRHACTSRRQAFGTVAPIAGGAGSREIETARHLRCRRTPGLPRVASDTGASMRTTAGEALIEIDTPVPAPSWALLERQLLDAQAQACAEFFERYFDERGYLLCVPRWSGDDGPDDALENVLNWTMLHALGAGDRVLAALQEGAGRPLPPVHRGEDDRGATRPRRHVLPGVPRLLRLVAPRRSLVADRPPGPLRAGRPRAGAPDAPLGRDVHGRGPAHPQLRPAAPGHSLASSTARAGRCCAQATALDWAGDPIDVAGRFDTLHGETSYQEMLDHFRDYTDVVGDNPMNLGATTLGLHGLRADRRDEVPRLGARVRRRLGRAHRRERRAASHERRPGRDDRERLRLVRRRLRLGLLGPADPLAGAGGPPRTTTFERAVTRSATALLLTGERRYVDVWRRMLDSSTRTASRRTAQIVYPHMYGRLDRLDRLQQGGTIDDLPGRRPRGLVRVPVPTSSRRAPTSSYYWTLDRTALDLLPETPRWVRYLDGEDESYPEDGAAGGPRGSPAQSRTDARRRSDAGHDDVGRHEPHQPGHDRTPWSG